MEGSALPPASRLATGVSGLDVILGGGLPAGRTSLVAGPPGSGKTTLGNQLAFHHASAGARVVVATLLAESHDVMLANLQGFSFFDPALVGTRVHYLNFFDALEEEGLAGVITAVRRVARETQATLIIVDGAAVVEDVAASPLERRRFIQQLHAQATLLGITTVLLTGHTREDISALGAHVDGIVVLANDSTDPRQERMVEVLKLRGGAHSRGTHAFTITESGLTIYPRLESVTGGRRPAEIPEEGLGLGTGVAGLDSMLGGGLLPFSSTLVMGPPGSGKTVLGLSFLLEGAGRGERGLLAGFHETEPDLINTAARIGFDLRGAIDAGLIRILWDPPLELSADGWAWRLLETVAEHRPQRVFVDALTDIQRFITAPHRMPTYAAALINELRARGATAVIASEIDAFVDDELAVPVPAASATMDNGILLRQVELRSSLHRLISVLKARQMETDPAIREFTISDQGITVSVPFAATSGLLIGRATPLEAHPTDEAP